MTGPQVSARPVIDAHSWTEQARLTLSGSYPAAGGALQAVLLHQASTDQHVLDVARSGDRFSIDVDAAAMQSFGRSVPLRDGAWDIYLRPAATAGGELITPGYDRAWLT